MVLIILINKFQMYRHSRLFFCHYFADAPIGIFFEYKTVSFISLRLQIIYYLDVLVESLFLQNRKLESKFLPKKRKLRYY